MRLEALAGRRVALWGLGREGWTTLRAIRRVHAELDLTILDDRPLGDETLATLADIGGVRTVFGNGVAAALHEHEVVIKSPGIPLRRPEIEAARAAGTVVTSATRIFFAERPDVPAIAITGTKGKSTTASLTAHLARAAGLRTELRGNIGRPLLDPPEEEPELWVIELSSYQTADLETDPRVAVLLNLYPEHLDWHGDVETYYLDKLRLFAHQRRGVAVLNREDLETRHRAEHFHHPIWFNDKTGFHVADGFLRRGGEKLLALDDIPLPGAHNHSNLCAALTALEAFGGDAASLAGHVATFRGLPHRLEILGERDGLLFVDDSISTTPQSALAAVDAFAGQPVTLLLGGHDRGLDYGELARGLVARMIHAVVTLPASGGRIAEVVRMARGSEEKPKIAEAENLDDAVEKAREVTPRGGVVLLSPAAPSYGAFRDFTERGEAFAQAVKRSSPAAGRPSQGRISPPIAS